MLTFPSRYWIQRYIFRRKVERKLLYHFDTSTGNDRINQMYANDKIRADAKTKREGEGMVEIEGTPVDVTPAAALESGEEMKAI
jgi:hypothetical protein